MFRFGLKNMRRLKCVEPIEIKPITILVGRNSSGKSTFLRTFPLIRQSIITRTSSPILWYGDLVDFGQYSSVVTGGNEQENITLSFGIDRIFLNRRAFSPELHYYGGRIRVDEKIDVDLVISGESGKTKLDAFTVNFGETGIRFYVEISATGELSSIYLGDADITHLFEGVDIRFSLGSLFPEVGFREKADRAENFLWYSEGSWAIQLIAKTIKGFLDQRIGPQKLTSFSAQLLDLYRLTPAEILKLEKKTSGKSFKRFLSGLRNGNNAITTRLTEIHEAAKFFRYLPGVFGELREMLSRTLYIGPVRARSERYYRYQDLAVSEIDPDGKNFPMFLNSLNDSQRQDFSDWVERQFGYGVEVLSESGHISINLIFGSDRSNIVDNGYGISQVLPVLGQIWWASRGGRNRLFPPNRTNGATIVIEQPELHLHPAHQALLADAIVGERNSDTEYEERVKFIVETHSEALVNRLGQLVADGKVPHGDVQVLVFEDNKSSGITTVRIAPFTEEGVLENWPYGFFQPGI